MAEKEFDRFDLKGLDRIEDVRARDENGQFSLIALRAALIYQSTRDPSDHRKAVEAWTDALIGGIIDC